MLDQLSERLQKVMKFLRGEGKISENNMAEALRMIRLAFLEADVNYKVVKLDCFLYIANLGRMKYNASSFISRQGGRP